MRPEPRLLQLRLLAATCLLTTVLAAGPARAIFCDDGLGNSSDCPDTACGVGECIFVDICFDHCGLSPVPSTVVCSAGVPGDACHPAVSCDGVHTDCPGGALAPATFTFLPPTPTISRGSPIDVNVTAAAVAGTVTVSGATFSGANPASFQVQGGTFPKTLSAGQSMAIRVAVVDGLVGTYSASLNLVFSAGCSQPVSLPVVGIVSATVPPDSGGGCSSGPAGLAALALLGTLAAMRFARRRR